MKSSSGDNSEGTVVLPAGQASAKKNTNSLSEATDHVAWRDNPCMFACMYVCKVT